MLLLELSLLWFVEMTSSVVVVTVVVVVAASDLRRCGGTYEDIVVVFGWMDECV